MHHCPRPIPCLATGCCTCYEYTTHYHEDGAWIAESQVSLRFQALNVSTTVPPQMRRELDSVCADDRGPVGSLIELKRNPDSRGQGGKIEASMISFTVITAAERWIF